MSVIWYNFEREGRHNLNFDLDHAGSLNFSPIFSVTFHHFAKQPQQKNRI
jgi:hypothetical protein